MKESFLETLSTTQWWCLLGRSVQCLSKLLRLLMHISARTVDAVLAIFVVREDPTQVHPSEQAYEVGKNHPEGTIVAVSPPWIASVR